MPQYHSESLTFSHTHLFLDKRKTENIKQKDYVVDSNRMPHSRRIGDDRNVLVAGSRHKVARTMGKIQPMAYLADGCISAFVYGRSRSLPRMVK